AGSTTVVSCPAGPFTYDGAAQTPCSATVTRSEERRVGKEGRYTNKVNAGTATAGASFAGDANHTASNDSKNFAIGKAWSTTGVSCSAGPFTYGGAAHTACAARVTGAGGPNQTLTVTTTNDTNAGTAAPRP